MCNGRIHVGRQKVLDVGKMNSRGVDSVLYIFKGHIIFRLRKHNSFVATKLMVGSNYGQIKRVGTIRKDKSCQPSVTLMDFSIFRMKLVITTLS